MDYIDNLDQEQILVEVNEHIDCSVRMLERLLERDDAFLMSRDVSLAIELLNAADTLLLDLAGVPIDHGDVREELMELLCN